MRETRAYHQHSIDEFSAGLTRERSFNVDGQAMQHYMRASDDLHPLHVDAAFARERGYRDVVVHGTCVVARCTGFVAEEFVGSHGLLISISSEFRAPVFCNEPLIWHANVQRIDESANTVEVGWTVTNDRNVIVQRGTAVAWLGSRT